MAGRLIEEDLFTKLSIIDVNLPEGQRIHQFLAARAQALAGKYIDFDKTPVTFLLSDSDEPNAFYAPAPDPENKPKRDDYETVRYIKNPLGTPVICITRGLIEMADSLDQLDFVLGHELTHMIMRLNKVKRNSKGEEEIADLHSVDLMYDAGSDPKQALIMSEKISAYGQEQAKKQAKKRYRPEKEKEEGINWSEIFDEHMTDANRKAGLEAALTRLSHLIDDKKPAPIDKSVLDAHYNDPVDAFLKANGYEGKQSLGKLKLLVDCIDHISAPIPAPDFFAAELAALPEEDPEKYRWRFDDRKEKLQNQIAAGYPDYFAGPVIEKKYQQKIASLAESIVRQVEDERQIKGNPHKPAVINAQNLNLYLQDRAYRHIAVHGYPVAGDFNYLAASGILYSYFYTLFATHSPRQRYVDESEDEKDKKRKLPQIEVDIGRVKETIRSARTVADFSHAVDEFYKLTGILQEIRTIKYGDNGHWEKLDNLSGLNDFRFGRWREDKSIYGELKEGDVIPWNNLVEIARFDEKTKDCVVKFLKQNGIEDYRITHGLPYVRVGYSDNYRVNGTGNLSEEIPGYELDFAVNRELVLQAYDYIKTYFENESSLIDKHCAEAANIDDKDFEENETTTDTFNRHSVAQKKIYDFISLFNALPDDNDHNHSYDGRSAVALIPERYQKDHPIPGSRKTESGYQDRVVFQFSKELLSFENPVFQAHFGEMFEAELIAKKEAQQQQMFDASFSILKKAIDIWRNTQPKRKELEEKDKALCTKLWDDETDDESKEAIIKEREPLCREIAFYREKDDQITSLVFNILLSIFDRDHQWYNLQRLKPEQKKILAEFVVRDEKDSVLPILNPERYEYFCDYLKILENQTDLVIAGDYQLSDMMQVVVSKYGYQSAASKETLAAFVDNNRRNRYSRDEKTYAWYMHVFDCMQHLEKTPSINVRCLTIALAYIQQDERSSSSNEPHEITSARYKNYRKFLIQSQITDLVARAVDLQQNYEGLSCDELTETADSLIAMKSQMEKIFSGKSDWDYSGNHKSQTTPKQEKFLSLVDNNIKAVLRRAEEQALQKDNALEKITDLYRLYKAYREYSSSDGGRNTYLSEIDKSEKRIERISRLSEDPSFWPEDAFEHVKAFVFAKNTFLDDKSLEDRILNNILDKAEALPPGRRKSDCLYTLLDKNLRAPYPETRDRLFALYTADVCAKLGKDDTSEKYQKRLAVYLKALDGGLEKDWDIGKKHGARDGLLSNTMSSADKYLLLRRLSDAIVSQEQTSQMAREACAVKLDSDDMLRSYLYGIGVDYLTEEMDRDPEMANKFIQFLNSKGEQKDCAEISAYIEVKAKESYSNWKDRLDPILKNTSPSNCKIFYENFWAAPLEARAVITARMLKSATNNENEGKRHPGNQSWEQVFDLVINNLIQPDDDSVDAEYARDIMRSYIKSRSDYERVLIMSAMMVANRNIGNDAGNIGKALKLFLENMGPAEIKLGQAISSHPDTPEKIKIEMQQLKNAADVPARWTLYDWIKAENIPEEFWKDQYLGEIMGSASYYTTAALGEESVLRILRPEGREKAAKGFRVIRSTVADLKEKEGRSDLSYRELTSSVQEMIIQAARMSDIETDHEIGQQQYEYAREIYNGVTINSGTESFPLKVMDWSARGKNWIIMDRAKGPTFNALPENAPEEIAYKRQFAKGYIVFELQNILSGRKFDHDKHGAQLSIDPETNAVGIYDTGAMALHDPKPEEQRLLGNIVHGALKDAMKGQETFSSFGRAVDDKINDLHARGHDTQYLVEVKKGLLALGDFFKILTPEDIKGILPATDLSKSTSKHVYQGITEGMSLFEKAQLQTLLTIKAAQTDRDIVVQRDMVTPQPAINVLNISVAPTTQDKAGWLQETFTHPDDDKRQSRPSSFAPVPDGLPSRAP